MRSLIRNIDLRLKVECAPRIKIKAVLFCIVFGFHYLCNEDNIEREKNKYEEVIIRHCLSAEFPGSGSE